MQSRTAASASASGTESGPSASASGPGRNRAENATRTAANGAGVAIKAAADVAGVGIKAAADVAGVGIKAAANVANEAALSLVKGVKKMVESGGLGGEKDGKKKDVEAGWWPWGANKRNEKEKEKEKARWEKMNAVYKPPPPQQAPTSSGAGPSSHQNSASTKNGKTQGGLSQQNSGLRTGEATGTNNPFQTVASKIISTDLREAIWPGGRKD